MRREDRFSTVLPDPDAPMGGLAHAIAWLISWCARGGRRAAKPRALVILGESEDLRKAERVLHVQGFTVVCMDLSQFAAREDGIQRPDLVVAASSVLDGNNRDKVRNLVTASAGIRTSLIFVHSGGIGTNGPAIEDGVIVDEALESPIDMEQLGCAVARVLNARKAGREHALIDTF